MKITYWMYKRFLISNCKGFKKLSFFKKIVSIKKDIKTMPDGRLVTIEFN